MNETFQRQAPSECTQFCQRRLQNISLYFEKKYYYTYFDEGG